MAGETEKPSQKRELAQQHFRCGYNCSQAVLAAFCDELCMTREQAAALAASFGGGMGRMREVCGACSAAFAALGILYGYDRPGDDEAKAAHYARVQTLASVCKALHGSIICRELLKGIKTDDSPLPTPRDAAFYEQRPCLAIIGDMAEALEQYLAKYPPAKRQYAAGAVVCDMREGECLFLLAEDDAGRVTLPNCLLRSGETEADCAMRAAKEMTGFSVSLSSKFRKTAEYPLSDGGKKVTAYHLATVCNAGEVPRGTCRAYPFAEALQALTFVCDRRVLEEAYTHLLTEEAE